MVVSTGKKSDGLFRPPKHKWLSKVVSVNDPEEAREAADKLVKALERGRIGRIRIGGKRALTIVQALNCAANRAETSLRRKNLSPKERREYKQVERIYRRATERARRIYHEKYR